jgi:hypothetical protein
MNDLDMEADMVPPLVTKLTVSVLVAVWIRETGSGPRTHVRANSEPSPTEGPGEPSRTRPSPARGAPHTDEFGSLGPEPSQTRTCMGTFTDTNNRSKNLDPHFRNSCNSSYRVSWNMRKVLNVCVTCRRRNWVTL